MSFNIFAASYVIGDIGPRSGWVFYVGTDGQHGLEAAPSDQRTGKRWYNGSNTNTEAHGIGVGAGERNTTLIIANQGHDSNSYAAGVCANLVIRNAGVAYGGWHLPSKNELNLMYTNIGQGATNVGGFANDYYWSSSENGSNYTWYQSFGNGSQNLGNKFFALRVRAVRAF